MKRILIVDDSDKDHPCPIMSVWHACGGTGKACCEENCPLPKLPDIDYSTKTLPLDDYTGNYDDAYELGLERGQEAIIDAITGGTP